MRAIDFLIEISGFENEAELYASSHGMEITFEGNGDKGEAYLTDKNTIIKVTSDNTEIKFAKKIIGKKLSNVVNIYDVYNNVIHMEYLDITDSEDLWSQMMQYDNGDGVQYIDIDKYDNISDDVIKYINDLQIGMMELTHNGIDNLDLKDDNIGRKTNGDWAIFDMSESKRGYW